MFNMLTNLTKAAVATALTPVAVAVDVVKLPSTALNNEPAFGATAKMLETAGECVEKAVKPE